MNRSYSCNSSRRGRGIAVVAFFLEDRSDILATRARSYADLLSSAQVGQIIAQRELRSESGPKFDQHAISKLGGRGKFQCALRGQRCQESFWESKLRMEANTILR